MKLEQTYSDIAVYGKKYHFYHNKDSGTIVCTVLYKGQIVRGTAKCSPEDDFNIGVGKQLAYLRCRKKLIKKKLKRARKAYNKAFEDDIKAKNNLYKAYEFVTDSEIQFNNVNKELAELEAALNIV